MCPLELRIRDHGAGRKIIRSSTVAEHQIQTSSVYIYINTYMHIYTYMYIHMYTYIYTRTYAHKLMKNAHVLKKRS